MAFTFTVEDGTGLAGANAYVSVSDADDYLSGRGYTAWAALTTAQKQIAIVKATDFIDNFYTFIGDIGSSTQGLSWPRDYAYDELGNAVGDDEVPTAVANACAEYARIASTLDIVKQPSVSPVGAVKRESKKVGPLERETEYAGSAVDSIRRYRVADKLLRKLIVSDDTLLRV